MVGNWKYQAYQAGYIAWGFFIQWLSFFIVILLFMWLFYLPFSLPIENIKVFWLELAIDYLPSFIWIAFILILQVYNHYKS